MKGLMNRKGDVTIATVILIILGLAVLIMLIIGFTKGSSFFFDLFDSAPSNVQSLSKFCEGYVQAGLNIDFCTYRLIDFSGDDELASCQHPLIKAELDKSVVIPSTMTEFCSSEQGKLLKGRACGELTVSKNSTIKVNGVVEGCTKA